MRVVIILALLAAATAVPRYTQRIVGGVPTTVEKYPFMARMEYNWWGSQFTQACGGSLISRTAIVSAAHCYYGDAAVLWRVVLGTSDRTTGGTVYPVARLINHEYYDRPWYLNNDVAILILSQPAVFSATVAPIKLAAARYDLPDFAVVTTIGWGSLASGGSQPDQLQEVDIDVIPQSICEDRYHALKLLDPVYEGWPDITEAMLCAGVLDVGGRDACQGDSGGPLIHGDVQDPTLVGIVSWGAGCADPYYPGVNARVSALIDWIVINSSS